MHVMIMITVKCAVLGSAKRRARNVFFLLMPLCCLIFSLTFTSIFVCMIFFQYKAPPILLLSLSLSHSFAILIQLMYPISSPFFFSLLCCNSVLSPLLLFLTSQVPASVPPELGLFLYSQSFQTSCHKTTTTHHTHTTIPIRNAELFFSTKANQNTLEKSQGKQMNTLFFLEIFQHEYCFGRKKKSYFTLKVKVHQQVYMYVSLMVL